MTRKKRKTAMAVLVEGKWLIGLPSLPEAERRVVRVPLPERPPRRIRLPRPDER